MNETILQAMEPKGKPSGRKAKAATGQLVLFPPPRKAEGEREPDDERDSRTPAE